MGAGVVRSTGGRVDTQKGGGVGRSGMGSLCDPLDASLSLSVSDTWGFWLLRAISEAGCVCVYLCLCALRVCACACTHKHARSCVRMGLGLRVWLVMGQPLGLPEACQGSLRQRPDGHLGSWEMSVEGLAGHTGATQVCRGCQSPCHLPREASETQK